MKFKKTEIKKIIIESIILEASLDQIENQMLAIDKKLSNKFKIAMSPMSKPEDAVKFNILTGVTHDLAGFFKVGPSQGNFKSVLSLIKQYYDNAVSLANSKKADSDSANVFIEGLKNILVFYKNNFLSKLSEQELNEAFGLKQKQIDQFIAALKPVQANGVSPDSQDKAATPVPQQAAPQAAKAVAKVVPIFKATPESKGDVLAMKIKPLLKSSGVKNIDQLLTQYLKMIANQLRANGIKLMEAKGDNLSAQLAGFRTKTATGMKTGVSGPIAPGVAGTAGNVQKGSLDLFGPAVLLLKQAGLNQKIAVTAAKQIQDLTGRHLAKYGVNLPQKAARVAKPAPTAKPEAPVAPQKPATSPPPPKDTEQEPSTADVGAVEAADLKKLSDLEGDLGNFFDQFKKDPEFPKEIGTTTLMLNILGAVAQQIGKGNKGEPLLAEGLDFDSIAEKFKVDKGSIEKLINFLSDEGLLKSDVVDAIKNIDKKEPEKEKQPEPEKEKEPESSGSDNLGDVVPDKDEKEKQAVLNEPVKFKKNELISQIASSIKSNLKSKNKTKEVAQVDKAIDIAIPHIKSYIKKYDIDAEILGEGKPKFDTEKMEGFEEFVKELIGAFKNLSVGPNEKQSLAVNIANALKRFIIDKVKEKEEKIGKQLQERKQIQRLKLLAGIIKG